MADLTITAANVLPSGTGNAVMVIAEVAITQGQPIYIDSATGTAKLAIATSLAGAAAVGIALNSAAAGQYVTYQKAGAITIGATVAAGTAYYVSGTAGKICPEADLGSGKYVTLLGFGISATQIQINIQRSGVAKP